jgi:hypothetical protein
MSRALGRIALFVIAAALLPGCASEPAVYDGLPSVAGGVRSTPGAPLQCVPYAREHSSIKLYGDAWTWWQQASGKYPKESAPRPGAVMVLAGYAGAKSGHVAVVRSLVNAREIRVDHANWLDDGAIYVDDPVADVSATNDWSQIRVWNIATGAWGGRIYPVQGFIGPAESGRTDLIARADIDEGQ